MTLELKHLIIFCMQVIFITCIDFKKNFRAEKNILSNDDELPNTPLDSSSYQLIITKEVQCNVDQVTKLVQQYVSECSLMANTDEQIIYNLPARKINQFGSLYSALEFKMNDFKLRSVKITNPTTGDIYPK